MPDSAPPPSPGTGHRERGAFAFKSRWWLNLALLAVVVLLTLLVILARSPQQPAGPALTAIAPESVTRVELGRPGEPRVVLEKQDGRWRMTEPVAARANDFNVERLFGIARAASEWSAAVAPGDYGRYGFDSPQARLRFDDEEIVVGSPHPLHAQHYVLHRDAAHLIASRHLAAAFYTYTDFLDSRLLEEDLRPVAFRLPGFTLALEDGAWRREPPDEELSSDRLNDFVAHWRNARALSVQRHTGTPAHEWVEISVERAGRTETLKLGILSRQPELVLLRPDEGLEYRFPEATGRRLLNISSE